MDINCLLIDDEPNNIENLQGIITRWCPGICVVDTAENAEDGVRVITATKPDLVFLDIQMPGRSSFDMLNGSAKIDFEVIFVTAYDQYGIQAIKFSALDYLLKPIDIADVQQAVEKARVKIAARQQNLSIQNLLNFIKTSQKEYPKIALPTVQETHYVRVNEIVRCAASNNYTTFFMQNMDAIKKSLNDFNHQ